MKIQKTILTFAISLLVVFAGAGFAFSVAGERPPQNKPTVHARLEIILPDFPAEGLILDIGGGGEGVIGQLKGKQVVAVDLSKQELIDAPGSPLLKIVMDARDLKFLDGTFATATVFFTFMYIDPVDHPQVLKEIFRILQPGGRLLVWDVIFPAKAEAGARGISYPIRIKLPQKTINTGYGVRIKEGQGSTHFVETAKAAGFEVVAVKDEAGWFYLELKKPA